MEEHRLKPMPSNLDVKLFEEIYRKTSDLRRKLASGIDHRRFGVEREDILAWFDTKFIFTFNKYKDEKPEILKAYIIKSLQFFKNRILRASYTKKNSVNRDKVDIEDCYHEKETHLNPEYNDQALLLNITQAFLKKELSKDAFLVLQCELTPPPYILQKLGSKDRTTKIPSKLISEYLGFNNSYTYRLKQEIVAGVENAKIHFRNFA